jgi:hypothetical protein
MKEKRNNKQPDPIIIDAMNTANEAEADYHLSEWIGAIFFYLIRLGKTKFEEVYSKKNRFRNVWTGWGIRIVFIILIILIVWKISETMDLF